MSMLPGVYELPEALQLAISPLASFAELLRAAQPDFGNAMGHMLDQSRTHLYSISSGLVSVCPAPRMAIEFSGLHWQPKCQMGCQNACCSTVFLPSRH